MTIIESARALLVDPQDRVLLMKLASNAHQTYWLTPGGSLHPGESFEDALRREIREETGLTLAHPGHWVWTSPKRIVRDGLPVDTLARVYIQRVSNFFAIPTALTSEERGMFRELRWWSIDEIAGSRETFKLVRHHAPWRSASHQPTQRIEYGAKIVLALVAVQAA